jgi:hypothetical protein
MIILGTSRELGRLTQWSVDARPVLLPLCKRHQSFRRKWPLGAQILLTFPIIILVVSGMLLPIFNQRPLLILIPVLIPLAIDLCLLGWTISAALKIRAVRVNSSDVTLIGISPEFVHACEHIQNREADAIGDLFGGLP